MAKRTDAEIISDLQDVECGLSPENLSCDGECSRAQTRARERALLAEKAKLIKELGRQPTNDEVFPA
jgi:hypothetical protein